MRKIILLLTIALLLIAGTARAQTQDRIVVANAGSTGTVLDKLAKLTGAPSTAVEAATTDTGGLIGIVVAGAGTSGNATVATSGLTPCIFDGATAANDYVQISATSAAECHDTGLATYPTAGQVLGRVLSTNGSGGTYTINLFPAEISADAGVSTSTNNSFTGNEQFMGASNCFKGPQPQYDATCWGASGSKTTTTLTSNVSSGATILPIGAIDFAAGEGVMVPGAGPTSSLSAPAGVAAVPVGTPGSTSHTYKVIAVDTGRGSSANTSVTIATANATLSPTNYVQGAIAPVSGAAFYAVYKDGTAWGTFAATASPSYAISSIARVSGTSTVTAVVNQNCVECNLDIIGAKFTVAGVADSSYDGTFTVTSATYVTVAVFDVVWTQSGATSSSSGGTLSQPIPFYDRGQAAVSIWPVGVPTTAPTSATAQWYIGTATAVTGAGDSLTVTPATSTSVLSGATVYHEDAAAINAAALACANNSTGGFGVGGKVLLPQPPSGYNAWAPLVFPEVSADGLSCKFELFGYLQVGNTIQPPGQNWSFQGLGGWGVEQFGRGVRAAIWSADAGSMPVLRAEAGFEGDNLSLGGYEANGVAFEGDGGTSLNYSDTLNATTSYGPSVEYAHCCWNFEDTTVHDGNGVDEPMWIDGDGTNSPASLTWLRGTVFSPGGASGIKIFEKTASQGPNINTLKFQLVSSDGGGNVSPLYNADARNVQIQEVTISDGGEYDTIPPGTPSLITILGQAGGNYLQDWTIGNTTQPGAVVGSSAAARLAGGDVCILGLKITNEPPGTAATQGTSCPATFSTPSPASSLTGGPHGGHFVAGTASLAAVITMGLDESDAVGWGCSATDLTTPADAVTQTASSTTTATLSGTVGSSDVIWFSCHALSDY